jgi:hypothetical protein
MFAYYVATRPHTSQRPTLDCLGISSAPFLAAYCPVPIC